MRNHDLAVIKKFTIDELLTMQIELSKIQVMVDGLAEEVKAMQAEARCPSCHRISYVDPPRHHQHREVDCAHCGHFFWLGAIYVSNDKVPDLSCKLTQAELAVRKAKT